MIYKPNRDGCFKEAAVPGTAPEPFLATATTHLPVVATEKCCFNKSASQ